jgi:hypothetical protein
MRSPRVALAILTVLASSLDAAPPVELFSGHDFAGWEFVTDPATEINAVCRLLPDGTIAAAGMPVGFIATTVGYENYRLHAEWRWPGKPGNSGVLVHINPGPKDRAWPRCIQIQTKYKSVGDVLPMAGATFAEPLAPEQKIPQRLHTAPNSEKPAGEWNTCDITCRGDTIEVTINGILQNRMTRVSPHSGCIGFQFEGTPYELRRVSMVRLD